MNKDFELHPQLTALAIAYNDDAFVADIVAPYFEVNTESFKWTEVDIKDSYDIDDDAIGEFGTANKIRIGGKLVTSSTIDRALDIDVQRKTQGTDIPFNSMQRRTSIVLQRVLRNRERRVASLLTTLGNYPLNATLSGTDRFSDFTNSDPVRRLKLALDIPLERPNMMILPREVATVLSVHPKVLTGVSKDSRLEDGAASMQALANLLEVRQIVVADARYNSAAKGQNASIGRIWGKDIALIHVNPNIDPVEGGVTFIASARYGTRVTRTIDDPKMGLYGGMTIRAGESVVEILPAPQAGYLFKDAIA